MARSRPDQPACQARPISRRGRKNEDMPERQYRILTKRIVDRLAVDGKDAVFRDRELPGFGVRVYGSCRSSRTRRSITVWTKQPERSDSTLSTTCRG